MNEKKRVLMTNFQCCRYTGSELHCLSIAKEFIKHDYEVTMFVVKKALPMAKVFEDLAVTVCEKIEELPENKEYDVFFAQHYPVADYLVDNYNFTCRYFVISILSSFIDIEHFTKNWEKSDLTLFVSDIAKNSRLKDVLEYPLEKVMLFPNYATSEFFNAYEENKKYKLKRIAVVSNHVPQECLKIKQLARENEISVDFFGIEFSAVEVNPEFLKNYDLVISIGKTVQYCMAQGIPIYCYDVFGGSGYINNENFDSNMKCTFSGKGDYSIQRNAPELFYDIVNNYDKNIKNISWLHQKALECFDLSKNFNNFLGELYKKEKEAFTLKDSYTSLEKVSHRALKEYIQMSFSNDFGYTQIYFFNDTGFNEKSYVISYNTEISISVDVDENVSFIRFDPDMHPCECNVLVTDENGKEYFAQPLEFYKNKDGYEDHHIFITNDPNYMIHFSETKPKKLNLRFVVRRLREDGISSLYIESAKSCELLQNKCDSLLVKYECLLNDKNLLSNENDVLLNEKGILVNQYNEMSQLLSQTVTKCLDLENSTSWKITKPFRKISGWFKKS